ncbi:hypothetical protein [Flavobacterium sp. UBA7663]|uniref:hypothetical protein n=1 Tax=Flavobacterium sp. UBA7663 TaxID=1946557 RepID=UPI0025C19430|nr:hypothetical protein [Flavobacterium sp. UBA7663]
MNDSSVRILFPFYQFYAFDKDNLCSYEDIKKKIFVPNSRNYQYVINKTIHESIDKINLFTNEDNLFKEDLLKVINSSNPQLLFEILLSRILRLSFNTKIEKINKDEITSEFIPKKKQFVNLLNYRIDLIKIEELLEDYNNNPDIEIDSNFFLQEIINFTYKFLFVKLSKNIYFYYSVRKKDNKTNINFKVFYETFIKFSSELETKNYAPFDFDNKQDYIESFYNSFKTDDIDYIEEIINELNLFSSHKESKEKLFEIINSNIKINPSLSVTKKNRLLLPFFKHITIVFFYREYVDLEEKELKKKFRKILNSK